MMQNRWVKRVIVLGGGTAGWMTASALSHAFGKALSIVLVESDAIGTIGVGEATIPPIRNFHQLIGVDEAAFMRATGATFKLGIEFREWFNAQSRYFHPFGVFGVERDLGYLFQFWLRLREQGLVGDFSDFSLCTLAARRNAMARQSQRPGDPLQHFHWAYHLDAGRYARFLKELSIARGVEHKRGDVLGTDCDGESGFVTGLRLGSGEIVRGDLFVDCSGIRAALIGTAMGVEFEDWSTSLPMNRAIAIPCERTQPLTPYTVSTAHSIGWQWRIPLQHRVGNGIVYSSDFASEDEASAQLLGGLEGKALADLNQIRFTTGRRREPWSGNVVAIGLSSGFLEPLESTSIHLIQSSIQRLIQYFPAADISPVCQRAFNRDAAREIENVRDFLILHYHATERDDSELWRYARTMPIPDSLRERIELFRDRGQINIAEEELFQATSWHSVLLGQGVVPRGYMPTMALQDDALIARGFAALGKQLSAVAASMQDHAAFIGSNNLASDS